MTNQKIGILELEVAAVQCTSQKFNSTDLPLLVDCTETLLYITITICIPVTLDVQVYLHWNHLEPASAALDHSS